MTAPDVRLSMAVSASSAEAALASGILASITSRLVLDQRGNGEQAVAGALDQIRLPVSGNQAALYLRRALVNAGHIWQAAAPVFALAAFAPAVMALAQAADQIFAQLTARRGVIVA